MNLFCTTSDTPVSNISTPDSLFLTAESPHRHLSSDAHPHESHSRFADFIDCNSSVAYRTPQSVDHEASQHTSSNRRITDLFSDNHLPFAPHVPNQPLAPAETVKDRMPHVAPASTVSHQSTHPQQTPVSATGPTTPLLTVHETSFADYSHLLWLTFSVHEQLNVQRGVPKYSKYGLSPLYTAGTPASEIHKFQTYRHSFPHVPQQLFSSARPDGLLGEFMHLT